MASEFRRVQLVISGPFLLLLLMAAAFFQAGFWLYIHRPPPPKPQSPPYYINRTLTAVRPCYQCVATDGKLKASSEWRFGKTIEIPSGEQWWFAPVEDPPAPAKIDGIPMLAVYPAKDNTKAWEGFDQHRIMLVVVQDVDGRFMIDHPATPLAPASTPVPNSPPDGATSPQVTQ